MASYAATIKDAFGIEPEIETGSRGQFDVLVDGKTVVSRKGGLMALLLRKPWPDRAEVVNSIEANS
ncbi:SelT/SelW/SelH family protein [Mariniblastus fucicola]|uniref:Rdx family protein n=1 Tax=Mariniblastus fucicola TaxID=980251 RepID=UPI00094629CB|nr:Rdx family protein [Mariniblastus fucicola]